MWNPIDQIIGILNQARLTERDKDCIRLLLALEIDLNFTQLALFFQMLCAGLRVRDAQQVRSVVGAAPRWERVRWESAPILLARSMNGDQLSRVGRFYLQLSRTSETYERLLPEGTVVTGHSDQSLNTSIFDQLNYLLGEIQAILDAGRPLMHHALTPAPLPAPHYYDGTRWIRMSPASLLSLARAERFGTHEEFELLVATLRSVDQPESSEATPR